MSLLGENGDIFKYFDFSIQFKFPVVNSRVMTASRREQTDAKILTILGLAPVGGCLSKFFLVQSLTP
jgi:hypothetical protein